MEKEILNQFEKLNTEYELYTHPPVFSAGDRYPMHLTFDAVVCKNLLVTTRNYKQFFLIMLPHSKTADLQKLRSALGCTRLGFANEEHARTLLHQEKGSIGVCGVVYDKQSMVEVVLDLSLKTEMRIAMHPGINTETVVMSFDHLSKYVKSCGNKITFFDFDSKK